MISENESKPIRAVMFDWDGTLTDAEKFFNSIFEKTRSTLTKLGFEEKSDFDVNQSNLDESGPVRNALIKIFGSENEEIITETMLDVWAKENPEISPEAYEIFSWLKDNGIPFSIVSNTPQEFMNRMYSDSSLGKEFPMGKNWPDIRVRGLCERENWRESVINPDDPEISLFHKSPVAFKKPSGYGLLREAQLLLRNDDNGEGRDSSYVKHRKKYLEGDVEAPVFYVGNTLRTDVAAARRLGMETIFINPDYKSKDSHYESGVMNVSSLSNVFDVLKDSWDNGYPQEVRARKEDSVIAV